MARGRYRNEEHLLEEEDQQHWLSYSDLMSALLLMFALFLMVTILHNQTEMEKKDQVIKQVVGVKSQLINQLKTSFNNSNLNMEVDPQTGAIRFSDGVFFKTNSYTLSDKGKKSLEDFVPKYISILLSPPFKDHIAEIIVEGHTDNVGSYLYNLDLSQKRAASVVTEILSDKFPNYSHKKELRKYITANGRSFIDPIKDKNGKIDKAKSRRVEFKFRLKDDQTIQQIGNLVKNNG